MSDVRAYIARVESADTEELARLLTRPTVEEEKALRAHFGDERYQRLRGLALKRSSRRGTQAKLGNVVVIPGIMGSDLTAFDREDVPDHLWVNLVRLMFGGIELLHLADDGRTDFSPDHSVRATGVLKRHYGELLLSLSERWDVRPFGYDWRKDVGIAAADLEAAIRAWFDEKEPVHIVAHSLGGLVARTFIRNYPERWQAMQGRKSNGEQKRDGKLIMLGTPNYGSLAILGAITGLDSMVRLMGLVDLRHGPAELLEIMHSFVSLYQILPPPGAPGVDFAEALYEPDTYGDLNVPPHHLQAALAHHESLSKVIGSERMIYIAGYNQPTFSNIKNIKKLRAGDPFEAFEVTWNGDNRVTHTSGILKKPDGSPITTFYIDETHGNLSVNRKVIAALDELLETGTTQQLRKDVPARRGKLSRAEAREQMEAVWEADRKRMENFVRRTAARSVQPDGGVPLTPDQREVEETLTRGFLSYRGEGKTIDKVDIPFERAQIKIRLLHGSIEEVDGGDADGLPIDAISVGHYLGLRPGPHTPELALDIAISDALPGKVVSRDAHLSQEVNLLLTQYSERGIIRGELGQPFFLTDPRPVKGGMAAATDRVIAIAGMGAVGRFGAPELTVLARELCWSLGRMGKRHLATVLIGAGNGNLSVRDAVNAWIRGVKQAITGSTQDERRQLQCITFVVRDGAKMRPIQEAILDEKRRLAEKKRLELDYQPIPEADLRQQESEEREREIREWRRAERKAKREKEPPPEKDSNNRTSSRITVTLEGNTYRFGALTETASIPEREIPLDPDLVMAANDELAAEWNPEQQLERGQFLERLLMPADLRGQLYTDAPLVLLLDSTTARIHWEMLAQTDLARPSESVSQPGIKRERADHETDFLGTSRSLTRQLRTTFAPPPEPPPPPRRIMRVLVVADPAEDAHLPGAEEEGVEIADLFESFNRAYETSENRVQVVRLFGPREATRTTVLRHLMLTSYDVLHFAGHCWYNDNDPAASGWLFTGQEYLTANELKRIDRIPRFVFSNACESGITPDRSGERNAALAPSFAEQFFGRGVSNFVCTAWPVEDYSARQFALTLYSNLLGLTPRTGEKGRYELPVPMHVAMREARRAIFADSEDARTWGAYQHYGDPYMQFFDATSMREAADASDQSSPTAPQPAGARKRRRRSPGKKKIEGVKK